MPVIDADTHVYETDRSWDFMDPADRRFRPLPQVVDAPGFLRGRTVWNVDGELVHRVEHGHPMFPEGSGDLSRPAARIRHMDELGVDYHVMFPTFFTNVIFPRPELQRALARSYNRWLGAVSADYPRLRWAVVPALHHMDDTLQMMEEGRRTGACGVFLRGLEGNASLDHPSLFPLYAKAAELDMAICVHAGNGSPAFAAIEHTQQPLFNVAAFVGEMAIALNALIVSRLPQRFPGLRFAFLESGAHWVPATLSRTRRMLEAFGPAGLGLVPSELDDDPMARNNLYVRYESYENLEELLRWVPADRLVLGTDYTHFDTSTDLHAHRDLLSRPGPSAAERECIVQRSAATLYGLN